MSTQKVTLELDTMMTKLKTEADAANNIQLNKWLCNLPFKY